MRQYYLLLIIFISLSSTVAQQTADINNSVQINADYSEDNNTITLNWEKFESASNYIIYGREVNATSWGSAIATLEATDSTFIISDVTIGDIREYRVQRVASTGTAYGYAYSGIKYNPTKFDRNVIIIIEDRINDALLTEIEQYKSDLEAEGYGTEVIITNPEETVVNVKSAIKTIYNTEPEKYKYISIIGDVPVPYAGNIGPDGHTNHIGAWPCDGFYGDIDDELTWTDFNVNNVSASQERNHNVPGDTKFDQSSFPSPLELAVGRIDFSNLPLFDADDIELTRRYLEKNHKFRKSQIKSKPRGIIENNFGLAEGFGQNGYRNIGALVGRDSTFTGDYDVLKSETYLWSYGAGGGNFQGASGISNTTKFSQDSIQSIFTMLFGSYFGDYDSANNFLRSALATGTVLSNVWAGRPHWHFHPMGMGATLGDCTLITTNNIGSYVTGFGGRSVHMALMGDPTLKMIYVPSPDQLTVAQNENNVNLSWTAPSDTDIDHYSIYRSQDGSIPVLLGSQTSGLSYIDSCVGVGSYVYYVASVRLEEGFTGSYLNESPYAIMDLVVNDITTPILDFSFLAEGLEVNFINNSENSKNHVWAFGDGATSTLDNPMHVYDTEGDYEVTLQAIGQDGCYEQVTQKTISVSSPVSVEETTESIVKIYPNPVEDILQLKSDANISNLKIYDMMGNKLYEVSHLFKESRIDVTQLVTGIYLLDVIKEDGKNVSVLMSKK